MLPYFPGYCPLQSLWELFAWLFQCPKSRYLLSAQKSRVWCFLKLLFSVFLLCQANGTSTWWVLEQVAAVEALAAAQN